jgi:1,4-alpha-glucan branching enzyme
LASAKQVWSRNEGYPGDASYRDFYRDIGFDLDLDYLRPYLPGKDQRGFTGIKYYRITGPASGKAVYDLNTARVRADQHAEHFLRARVEQIGRLTQIMDHPPIVLCPYDAELFGHWWYEGIDFLNFFVRKAYYDQKTFDLITPGQFLHQYPTHQVASPAPSSWGEDGYWRVWLNETTEWIYPHLRVAQERMSELVRTREPNRLQFPAETGTESRVERALKQAARELLLAQASDWPFILRTGTSPGYARKRVTDHLLGFTRLYEEIQQDRIDEKALKRLEEQDNLFPEIEYRYFQ